MSRPKAYAPEQGYKFQILCRGPGQSPEWEHCDYAKDRKEALYMVREYATAYGPGWEFRREMLPAKYWPQPATTN